MQRRKVYLLWEIRKLEKDQVLGLRGIFSSKKNLKRAKLGLEKWDKEMEYKGRHYIIEPIILNHLCGFQDIKRSV